MPKTNEVVLDSQKNGFDSLNDSVHGSKTLFSTKEVAEIFEVSRSTVQGWGIVPKGRKGRADLYSISDIIKLRLKEGDSGLIDERKEKAKKAKYDAESARMDLLLRQGKMVFVADVQKLLDDYTITLRNNMLSIPAKVSPELEKKDSRKIFKILTKEVKNALNEAAEILSKETKTS